MNPETERLRIADAAYVAALRDGCPVFDDAEDVQ